MLNIWAIVVTDKSVLNFGKKSARNLKRLIISQLEINLQNQITVLKDGTNLKKVNKYNTHKIVAIPVNDRFSNNKIVKHKLSYVTTEITKI